MNENAKVGIGGAPTRATTLPDDAQERKQYPVASGVLDYFPDAIVALSRLSWVGNEQHNANQPLHWARGKSGDEADTMMRHFLQRGTNDTDGQRHTVKMAWRALALLQKEIEAEQTQSRPVDLDTPRDPAFDPALKRELDRLGYFQKAPLEPGPLDWCGSRAEECVAPEGITCDQWCERRGCIFQGLL